MFISLTTSLLSCATATSFLSAANGFRNVNDDFSFGLLPCVCVCVTSTSLLSAATFASFLEIIILFAFSKSNPTFSRVIRL